MEYLSERVLSFRNENNITQQQFAEMAKITQTAVSQIESRKRTPVYKTVYRIAKVINCDVNKLISSTDKDLFEGIKKLKKSNRYLIESLKRGRNFCHIKTPGQIEDMINSVLNSEGGQND